MCTSLLRLICPVSKICQVPSLYFTCKETSTAMVSGHVFEHRARRSIERRKREAIQSARCYRTLSRRNYEIRFSGEEPAATDCRLAVVARTFPAAGPGLQRTSKWPECQFG